MRFARLLQPLIESSIFSEEVERKMASERIMNQISNFAILYTFIYCVCNTMLTHTHTVYYNDIISEYNHTICMWFLLCFG